MNALRQTLRSYGALDRDYVDLAGAADPRGLRYTDLTRDAANPLVDGVIEQQAQALLYVVDHTRLAARPDADAVQKLRRELAMRGDSAWLGVVYPGRLDLYATDLRPDPNAEPVPFAEGTAQAQALLPRLVQGEAVAPPGSLRLRDELLRLMNRTVCGRIDGESAELG